jgi:hypothetical protein
MGSRSVIFYSTSILFAALKPASLSGSQISTVPHQSTPKQVRSVPHIGVTISQSVRLKLIVDLSGFILAVCFKNAKQFDQAKDAYLKEAEYHTENKTYP